MTEVPQTSIMDELTEAARGFVALVTGNRQAASYFDFSQRGLIGSFIALIVAAAINAYGPALFGMAGPPGVATYSIILAGCLFALQLGVIHFVLRQMGRLDGFLPYLVADNWIGFFISLLTLLMLVVLRAGEFGLLVVGILAIVLEVNIARLIVTLAPMQVVMFIGAQIGAQLLGVLILGAFLPGASAPAV